MSTQEQGTALSQKVADAAKSISNIPGIEEPVAFIEDRLAQLGIYGEEDHEILISNDCTEGDARCVFCEGEPPVLPVPRFKRMWRILKVFGEGCGSVRDVREADLIIEGGKIIKDRYGIMQKPYGQWKDEELLNAYGIDSDIEILETLEKRAHNRNFIVFEDEKNCTVDIPNTLRVLRLARRQDTPETFLTAAGIRKLYPVGMFPSIVQTECPLHPGTLLFGNYCDDCKKSWEDIDYDKMQFARLVMKNGEGPEKPREIRAFIEDLKISHVDDLGPDYPAAYHEFFNSDDLPNIRKKMSSRNVEIIRDPINPTKRCY